MSDYISREAAIKEFGDADADVIADYGADYGSEYGYSINKVREVLQLVPAADVAPVRRGEWIEYACSAYGGIDEYGDVKWIPKKKFLHEECGRWNAIREPFCPNCGAEMGGKQ